MIQTARSERSRPTQTGDQSGVRLRMRHAQTNSATPIRTTTAPTTAHTPWPLIPDPCMRFVPWAIQTTPTKQMKNPDTILDHIADSDLLVTARHVRRTPNVVLGSPIDRKSTRLNSSHANISYAVFC